MLRRLLTLLALCAGLAAIGQPAHASATATDSVRLVEQANRTCGVAVPAVLSLGTASGLRSEDKGNFCPRPVLTIIIPPVMLQADRARE